MCFLLYQIYIKYWCTVSNFKSKSNNSKRKRTKRKKTSRGGRSRHTHKNCPFISNLTGILDITLILMHHKCDFFFLDLISNTYHLSKQDFALAFSPEVQRGDSKYLCHVIHKSLQLFLSLMRSPAASDSVSLFQGGC